MKIDIYLYHNLENDQSSQRLAGAILPLKEGTLKKMTIERTQTIV